MGTQLCRPLTPDDFRSIIRAHPAVFAAIMSVNDADPAMTITKILMDNSQVMDSIIAAGTDRTLEAAARLGLMKWPLMFMILNATTQVGVAPALLTVMAEEFESMFGGGKAAGMLQ